MMGKQQFKTADVLRLLVGRRPKDGLVNLVKNPSGALGGWGWVTPNPGQVISGTGTRLRLTPTGTQACWAFTEDAPVTPGWQVSGRVRTGTHQSADETMRTSLTFYDATGTEISTTAQSGGLANNVVGYTPTVTAPAGAARVALRVQGYTSGGNLGGGRHVEWRESMLVCRQFLASAYLFVEPYEWTDIISPATSITIDREDLNLGLLSAVVYSAALDPATDDLIRPGNPVTVQALATNSEWHPLFTGTISNGASTYDYSHADPDKRAKITLTGVDAVSTLANVKRPDGVATVPNLRAVLEGCGVPWIVNGNTSHSGDNYNGKNHPLNPVFVVRNKDASALDQVAITRDSTLAKAWVTRAGQIAVYDAANLPTPTIAVLDETACSELNVDYDTDRCINSVTVKLLRKNIANGETVEVTYGPYVDQASVEKWGARSAEFRVQGIADNEVTVATYAAQILAANATPQVRVNSVRVPITKQDDFGLIAVPVGGRRVFLDLYDLVAISNGDYDTYPDTYENTY